LSGCGGDGGDSKDTTSLKIKITPNSSLEFTIPTNPAYGYNYKVDCESDGTYEEDAASGDYTCTYNDDNNYTISIAGDFPAIYFNFDRSGDGTKLLDIVQWGNIAWESMQSAFYGCTNMAMSATDKPDLSGVENMSRMFQRASTFNQDIGDWDVSTVTDMSNIFNDADEFNQSIGNWDVSLVGTMEGMFQSAHDFNQDIGEWNVSIVSTMEDMFRNTPSFNQAIGDWNVSSVTNMQSMFTNAKAFNQDIENWDTHSVINMQFMLGGATAFDQNIGGWDISLVRYMSGMFSDVTLSTVNYSAILHGWASQTVQQNVTFNGGNSKYYSSVSSDRDTLTNTNNWTIEDGGEHAP